MTREEAIANIKMISAAFVEPVTEEQGKLIDDTFDMAIKALQEQEEKKENYPEYLKAVARELKTFCEFQSDQSRRCLECYFWNDTEGWSIYNWPEYWEV